MPLTSLANSRVWLKLDDVTYGTVSPDKRVPAGTSVAAMTPAGGRSRTPVINQSVTVEDNDASTVAAVGERAGLTGEEIADDLTPPAEGRAKVRLLQASTVVPTVDGAAVQGPTLARGARSGSTTGYAQIKPGVWTSTISPTSGGARAESARSSAPDAGPAPGVPALLGVVGVAGATRRRAQGSSR